MTGHRIAVSHRLALSGALLLTVAMQSIALAQPVPRQTRPLPTVLSDTAFWNLSARFSEPGGYFQSDNFTSNEAQYPAIVGMLLQRGKQGGAYIGVGPEQNFQYIVALRPQIVFQLDIRRQAIMQHLMYKAIFELTSDRADFLSLLFSKPRPAGLSTASTIAQIWDAYWFVPTDTLIFTSNFARVRDHLTKTRGFALSPEDVQSLGYVYEAFYRLGPNISYGGYNSPSAVTFGTLTAAVDSANTPRSFLGTEENFRFIKEMHTKNLIVPVVADFAGLSGIRSVAAWLHQHDTRVTAFYVSNVESYLFRNGVANIFYANVATLPLDSSSVFIRPSGGTSTGTLVIVNGVISNGVPGTFTLRTPAGWSSTLPGGLGIANSICPIQAFLAIHAATPLANFNQAVACGR